MEIRDNLKARIKEAEREGWLGEVEGLRVSLAGAEEKLGEVEGLRVSLAGAEEKLGEVEGLRVSLAGAEEKLAQLDRRPAGRGVIDLGILTITSRQPQNR
ncbi:hypothetical protein [Streptomyces lunaelactis]|uniref:hypothetical protein n=1 Tax=Streptomyces lunaelactis TaxID=1535768 RepID=UPI0020C7886E|nr:hypothetical protein [Streptomyces lunaelactis]